ncbi:hypothetical protein WR25_05840 [Diploscapter pachys]|uniref:Uncharacterized protein n=1 Tax=Diploscapter pachys TaxID=2018661 RepID=A0A2A2K142_9BILA|nr:hypothetical protein WR25_05840 [Diploscapter pachys]
MSALASGSGRRLPARSRIELGHGLGRGLAVAAGFLAPLAAGDNQPRLFRVETEIASIPWFNQSASSQSDGRDSGNERAFLEAKGTGVARDEDQHRSCRKPKSGGKNGRRAIDIHQWRSPDRPKVATRQRYQMTASKSTALLTAGKRGKQERTEGHSADPCWHRNQRPDSRDHSSEQNRPTAIAVEPAIDMIDLVRRQRQPSTVARSKALQPIDADPAPDITASSDDPIEDGAEHEDEGEDRSYDRVFQSRALDVPDPRGDLPSGADRTPPRPSDNSIQFRVRQPEECFGFTARSTRQPHHTQHHIVPCDIDRARPIDHRAARVTACPRGRQQADDLVRIALQQRRPAQQAVLAVPRRDSPRRRPTSGEGLHWMCPSARLRGRHGLAGVQASPLVARLSGREQRRAVADGRPERASRPQAGRCCRTRGFATLLQDRAAPNETDACNQTFEQPGLRRGRAAEDRDAYQHEAATGDGNQRECADACATGVLLAIPANRKGKRTCDDGGHDGGGFRNVAHPDRVEADLDGGIVISTGEDRIADEQHAVERHAAFGAQALQAVAFVDPCPRHVDRCRTAKIDREARQHCAQGRLQCSAFFPIPVPSLLFLQRRRLPQPRKGNLAAAILDPLAPYAFIGEAGIGQRPVEGRADLRLLRIVEQLGIDHAPSPIDEAIELGAGGRHQPEAVERCVRRQARRDLLFELWPVPARDHRHIGNGEQPGDDRGHILR